MSPESAVGGRLNSGRRGVRPFSAGAKKKKLRDKQPIVTTLRQSPEAIRNCVKFLFGQAGVNSCSERSKIVRDVDHLLKYHEVDVSAFERQGVRPVKIYIQRRLIRIRFIRKGSERPYIVKVCPNDYGQ